MLYMYIILYKIPEMSIGLRKSMYMYMQIISLYIDETNNNDY